MSTTMSTFITFYPTVSEIIGYKGVDNGTKGMNILHCAANQNCVDIIKYLFEAIDEEFIFDINAVDRQGHDCLHLAAKTGSNESLETLLTRVSRQDEINKNGRTALHLAALGGHTACLELLLSSGFKVNVCDQDGNTPLHLSAEQNHHVATTCLLKADGDPNIKNLKQMTSLHVAASLGHLQVSRVLLENGANVNIQNEVGNTTLHLAAAANHRHVLVELVNHGANINLPNYRLLTPLQAAVERGQTETVEQLLVRGADTYAQDKGGRTALYMAARGSYIGIVDMIIKAELNKGKLEEFYDALKETPQPSPPAPDEATAAADDPAIVEANTEPDSPYKNIYKTYRHPNSDIMKPILFKLAHKSLGAADWEKLARSWQFNDEHIAAIKHQYSGDSSYKEHGYRMLLIWLFGVNPTANPMKELYESLVSINRKSVAERVRRKIEAECDGGGGRSNCSIC